MKFWPQLSLLNNHLRTIKILHHQQTSVRINQLERRCEIYEKNIAAHEAQIVSFHEFGTLVKPQKYISNFERLGSQFDGGYFVPSALVREISNVLSIGVGEDNLADIHLAKMGHRVHAWDHTIKKLPVKHPNIVFHKTGVGKPEDGQNLLPLPELLDRSFPNFEGPVALMMDVEGQEWESLMSANDQTMSKFGLMVIEFHNVGNLIFDPESVLFPLRKIRETHTPVVLSTNNYGASWKYPGNVTIPDVVEVTYVLNSDTRVSEDAPGIIDDTVNLPNLEAIDMAWVSEVN